MRNIEVYVSDGDASMLINVDNTSIELTAEEAAYLMSMMARADRSFHLINSTDVDPPGAPLTKITPVHRTF